MRVYIAGIKGMVGRALETEGLALGYLIFGKSSRELDFRNRGLVFDEMRAVKPDVLVVAAAKVGGIGFNQAHPVSFLSENLQIQTNIIDAAYDAGIRKLIFLGSSCIYPKYASQPITENSLLSGLLESTNEAYAIAKIAGVKLVQYYREEFGNDWLSLMPTNLYGPWDNFHDNNSHVIPALISRIAGAKRLNLPEVTIWGDGSPKRSFLFVDDFAKACYKVIGTDSAHSLINVGSDFEITIHDLARLISEKVGYTGHLFFDKSKPNGTPRKILDSEKIKKIGWRETVELEIGISRTLDWYQKHKILGEVRL